MVRGHARGLAIVGLCLWLAACTSESGLSGSPSSSPTLLAPGSSTSSGTWTPRPPVPQSSGPVAVPAWTTYQQDAARSGIDPSSPPLGTPRLAWTSPGLDGAVYAQPLVLGDRVYVATEGDSVYALDATTGAVIWRRNLGQPVPRASLPCGNIDATGITGTPVIDPSGETLYAVAFVQPGWHELVALDVGNGKVRFRRSSDPPGADPLVEQQRAALTISKGRVYAAYGGLFGDCGDYHGIVVGSVLDGSGPLLSYVVPSGRAAGIWAPPGPTVTPNGDLLVVTGNSFSGSSFDLGNSVIRLSSRLDLVDWFAPTNWAALNAGDVDLGSTGPTLLPGGLAFAVGKEGVGYLLRLADLGHIGGEVFAARVCDRAFGGTAVDPPFVYVSCTDGIAALRLGAGPSFRLAWRGPGFDAGPPIVSAGAVWTLDIGAGDLYALDARTGSPRYRAHVGDVPHFASPAAGDGRLFLGTLDGVVAYTTS